RVADDQVAPYESGERRLHRGRSAQAMAGADVGGEQPTVVFEHDRPQNGALCEGEPLPDGLEHHLLFGEQALERLVQVVECRAAPAAAADLVPGLMREPPLKPPIAWNSSSATTTLRRRVSASRAGSANTSPASREMSRSDRTFGKDTKRAPRADSPGAYRTSARAERITSRSHVRARSPVVAAATSARA